MEILSKCTIVKLNTPKHRSFLTSWNQLKLKKNKQTNIETRIVIAHNTDICCALTLNWSPPKPIAYVYATKSKNWVEQASRSQTTSKSNVFVFLLILLPIETDLVQICQSQKTKSQKPFLTF